MNTHARASRPSLESAMAAPVLGSVLIPLQTNPNRSAVAANLLTVLVALHRAACGTNLPFQAKLGKVRYRERIDRVGRSLDTAGRLTIA